MPTARRLITHILIATTLVGTATALTLRVSGTQVKFDRTSGATLMTVVNAGQVYWIHYGRTPTAILPRVSGRGCHERATRSLGTDASTLTVMIPHERTSEAASARLRREQQTYSVYRQRTYWEAGNFSCPRTQGRANMRLREGWNEVGAVTWIYPNGNRYTEITSKQATR